MAVLSSMKEETEVLFTPMEEDSDALLGGPQPTPLRWMKDNTHSFAISIPGWIQSKHRRFIMPLPPTARRVLVAAAAIVLLAFVWLALPQTAKDFLLYAGHPPDPNCPVTYLEKLPTCKAADGSETKATIPNIVHYVFLLKDPESDFPFQFSHFLSMYSAYHFWNPDTIYLHTNVDVDSSPVRRAYAGQAGKWTRLIFGLPQLVINTVEVPEHANGINITMMEHKSDFIRVKMVHQYGGIYLDLDVQPLRSINALRHSGYHAIGGREFGFRDEKGVDHIGNLNSGTFMSVAGGAMITRWMQRMNDVFDGGWVTHSNIALTAVAEELVASNTGPEARCEMLVLNRDGFAPGSWMDWDVSKLFDIQTETVTPEWPDADFRDGDPIPADLDLTPGVTPAWATNYNCTYLLHAFSPKKARNGASNNGINPRYVLERKSNYARAVYPVARAMYNEGLLSLNDTDLGV